MLAVAAPPRLLGVRLCVRRTAPRRSLVCARAAPDGSRPSLAHYAAAPGLPAAHASSSSSCPSSAPRSPVLDIAPALQLPVFAAPAHAVRVLDSPAAFYAALQRLVSEAHEHVFLASLYLGPGEAGVIAALREALRRRPHLRCTVLLDYQRSTREGAYVPGQRRSHSSASLLAPLVRDFPAQCEVRLFRAPGLPAWAERMLGKRLVEGWGLQHMKCYGHEGTTLWSGANLSRDYFTNRQDRYMTLVSRALSAYARALLLLVARHSYLLCSPDPPRRVGGGPLSPPPPPPHAAPEEHGAYTLEWDGGRKALLVEGPEGTIQRRSNGDMAPAPGVPEHGWRRSLGRDVAALTARWTALARRAQPAPDAVRITPLLQMGQLGIAHETRAAPLLLPALGSSARLALTSGYFGLSRPWAQLVLRAQAPTLVLAAAPRANGFFGSKGISRHLPPAYTWLERRFWIALGRRGRRGDGEAHGVRIVEWEREGWTYHAKGIWLAPGAGMAPQHTLIGSSNLGRRSARRDLEASLLISLPDETRANSSSSDDEAALAKLRSALDAELRSLRKHATQHVDAALFARKERYVHPGVRVAAWCIQSLL